MDVKITDQQKIEFFDQLIKSGQLVYQPHYQEPYWSGSSELYPLSYDIAAALNAADPEIVKRQQEKEDAFNNKLLAGVKKVEDWKSRNYSLQELCEKVVHSEMKLDGSNHMECLKLIKDVSGCGLKESKDAYDLARSRR